MSIVLTAAHKGGEHTLQHDLNFQSERYEAKHQVVRSLPTTDTRSLHPFFAPDTVRTLTSLRQTFRNPKPELLALLQDSGSADANGVRGKDASKIKKRRDKAVDMEKLADGLQKLSEDDLLHVVTMIHDNKTSETYTKNDVESTYALQSGVECILFAHVC